MDTMTPTPAFRDVCALLRLGDTHLVQKALEQQPTCYSSSEQAYLQAWMACERGLVDAKDEEAWGKALTLLLQKQVKGATAYHSQAHDLTPRSRRPWIL